MAKTPYYDPHNGQVQNGGKKPRIDYDSDLFYDCVAQLASNGANDSEIAVGLKYTDIKLSITPNAFSRMKRGHYDAWTEEENERRGFRLRKTIDDARTNTNRLVRAVYLSTALGKSRVKNRTTVTRRLRIDGELTDNEEIQTTEVDSGIAPNIQALATWLYHYDKDWRRVHNGEPIGEEESEVAPQPSAVKKGVSIHAWLDRELMDMDEETENVGQNAQEEGENVAKSGENAQP